MLKKISKIKHYYIDPALMAKLDGKLWIYTEIIFSRWHNLAHEFHGPYSAGKPTKVINQGMARFNRFRLENF